MGKPVTGWSSKHVFHAILLRAALQGLATFLVRTVIAAVATVFRAYPNHDARSLTPARMSYPVTRWWSCLCIVLSRARYPAVPMTRRGNTTDAWCTLFPDLYIVINVWRKS